jgi:hypothetical protein
VIFQVVFDLWDQLVSVVDAPVGAMLACPMGILVALHFAGGKPANHIGGPRADKWARESGMEVAVARPAWINALAIGGALGTVIAASIYFDALPNLQASLQGSLDAMMGFVSTLF